MNTPPPGGRRFRIRPLDALPTIGVHLLALAALLVEVETDALYVCLALFWSRMFFVTAGYHRYFSHRSFQTSRLGQFVLAFLAQTSCQKGVLWWASNHRHHHRHTDTERDLHSPRQGGFWHAHMRWLFDPEHDETKLSRVRDLARFPELRWLDRNWLVPPAVMGVTVLSLWGLDGLLLGFFGSTVLVWHATFTINSLSHVWGTQPYATNDDSRNNVLLALVTLGEGWHNNHHHHMLSCRQGFRWWQIDITYYGLVLLSWLGLVWDLRKPPTDVLNATRAARTRALVPNQALFSREAKAMRLPAASAE